LTINVELYAPPLVLNKVEPLQNVHYRYFYDLTLDVKDERVASLDINDLLVNEMGIFG